MQHFAYPSRGVFQVKGFGLAGLALTHKLTSLTTLGSYRLGFIVMLEELVVGGGGLRDINRKGGGDYIQ